jgi:hypothetical protein
VFSGDEGCKHVAKFILFLRKLRYSQEKTGATSLTKLPHILLKGNSRITDVGTAYLSEALSRAVSDDELTEEIDSSEEEGAAGTQFDQGDIQTGFEDDELETLLTQDAPRGGSESDDEFNFDSANDDDSAFVDESLLDNTQSRTLSESIAHIPKPRPAGSAGARRSAETASSGSKSPVESPEMRKGISTQFGASKKDSNRVSKTRSTNKRQLATAREKKRSTSAKTRKTEKTHERRTSLLSMGRVVNRDPKGKAPLSGKERARRVKKKGPFSFGATVALTSSGSDFDVPENVSEKRPPLPSTDGPLAGTTWFVLGQSIPRRQLGGIIKRGGGSLQPTSVKQPTASTTHVLLGQSWMDAHTDLRNTDQWKKAVKHGCHIVNDEFFDALTDALPI